MNTKFRFFTAIALATFFCASNAQAQFRKSLDKIVVIVGDHIALQSEVNQMLAEYKQQMESEVSDTFNCTIVESMITKYLLCEQAARDSVTISEEEVEANLNNRLRYMEQVYGSVENMETVMGRTSFQIKEDYRKYFKDQMLSQRMQGQLQQGIKISPAEVRTFFDQIPKDSLPMYPSMVEVGQLVLAPIASKDAEDYAKQQLLEMKQQILDGKSQFETLASIYSQDPGSKNTGGQLGTVERDQMVPEFSAAAFRLQNGEMSEPVKTKYGYHLIQMQQRMGEKAKIRHILIKPTITSIDIVACQQKLDSIRQLVTQGKYTFADAVAKFSNDDATKNTGGMVVNPNSGSSLLTMEEMGGELAATVGELKQGEYSIVKSYDATESNPTSSATPNENIQCRFVYLKSVTEPHQADLSKDFSRIQQVALDDKRAKFMRNWTAGKTNDFYIYIAPEYVLCTELQKYNKTKN